MYSLVNLIEKERHYNHWHSELKCFRKGVAKKTQN